MCRRSRYQIHPPYTSHRSIDGETDDTSAIPAPHVAFHALPVTPATGELGAIVSNEALDALNTIQVLKLASAGNPMAEDFVDKLEHHLRTIIKQAEGETHWPEKYKIYFKEEVAVEVHAPPARQASSRDGEAAAAAGIGSSGTPASTRRPGSPSTFRQMSRAASTRLAAGLGSSHGGAGGEGMTEEERLSNFEFAVEDEDDDDEDLREARVKSFRLGGGMLGSPGGKRGTTGSSSSSGKKGEVKSDVDIYNIINAEEKDTGATAKRKGLALGQALSHSMKTVLYNETAGSRATKHPVPAFTHNRATDVSFHDVTFSFQEYAPVIFLSVREHFGIDNEAFVKSMSELKGGQVGEGKSGMLFFSSADREFIVKTVTKNELKFLERELKSYYDYMVVNGATSLLPRFMGLYFLKLPDKPIVRLIVMNNVFNLPRGGKLSSSIELVEMYDLKGSLHTRYVGAEEQALGKVSVLKDLNFCSRHEGTDNHGHPFHASEGPCRNIYLGPIRKIELLANLQSDVEWLRQHNIMDYSLLLAVGFEVSPEGGLVPPPPGPADPAGVLMGEGGREGGVEEQEQVVIVSGGGSVSGGATAGGAGWQSAWSMDLGGVRGMNGDFTPRAEIYYMGVIDILQEYNAKKRAEHTLKSFTADSSKISAVDPSFYAERFLDWLQTHVG